jgi:hypothetical protein
MTTGARYTLVPDAIDALVAMFGSAAVAAALSLPSISDGQPATLEVIDSAFVADLPAHYVAVGYSAAFASQGFSGSTGLTVDGVRVLSDVGNRQFGESFSIFCELSTTTGDSDPAALARLRQAAAGALAALWQTIEADPTLHGVVLAPAYAAVTSYTWLQDQAEDGAAVTVRFQVGIVGELWVPR